MTRGACLCIVCFKRMGWGGLTCSPACARSLIEANRRETQRSPNTIAAALRDTRASVERRIADGRKAADQLENVTR